MRCRRFNMTNYRFPYLANIRSKEFHDVSNEKANCQLQEIIDSGNDKGYPTKESAKKDGYDPCHYCMPGESRR